MWESVAWRSGQWLHRLVGTQNHNERAMSCIVISVCNLSEGYLYEYRKVEKVSSRYRTVSPHEGMSCHSESAQASATLQESC